MNVPLLDLQAQFEPIRDEILAAITRVCDSQRFILGPEVDALEDELARWLGIEYAITVSSGTDALLLALMSLGIGPGDEVITSTYSFFATAGSIVRVGARPVLVDIEAATFNLDPAQVEAACTERTRAIIPVHLFGLSADLDPILETAQRRGIPVIEDAAQAIGSKYKSKTVGGLGAFGCFSFFPSKNLGAFGDGGLLVTRDARLAKQARLLRNHGMEPKYHYQSVGGNFRLDALQAAILRVKLRYLPTWGEARRLNARRYRKLFAEARLLERISLPTEPADRLHAFNQFVIRTPDREELRAHLQRAGIGTEVYYPVPFHLQPCFANLGYAHGSFPASERAADESLALPIYGELTVDQQQHVVQSIRQFM